MKICGGLNMPKAQNIEEKYINGIKVDKEDEMCAFNDEQHLYFNKQTGETYTSVTQLISKYCQEFNEEFWSAYKALESILDCDRWSLLKPRLLASKRFSNKTLDYIVDTYNINKDEFLEKQSEIKKEYKEKRDTACARGTAIHLEKELSMYGLQEFDFEQYGFSGVKGKFTCVQNHNVLDLEKGVYPEFLISATFGDLTLVGQIDLLIIDGNNVYIGDYKSNREIKKTSYFDTKKKHYQMMLPPINNLMDSTLVHYQLQLSLYARMIQQRNPNYNIKQLQIIHIDHDGKQILYEVPYLKDDVDRLIKDYAKKQRVQKLLDLDKPYIV